MNLEWYIGRRYLASRRGTRFLSLITAISIGGVTVGVMALIIVTAVMTGLQTDLRDKILGTNPHIWLTTFGETMRLDAWQPTLDKVRRAPGVTAAAPFVHTEVGLTNRAGYAEAAILRGIDPGAEGPPVTDIVGMIRRGEARLGETKSGYPPLLVGASLAERFGLYEGDVVDVISMQGATTTPLGGLQPRMRKFEVAGRFKTGMYEYDNKFMYTTLAAGREVANLGNAVSGLEVRVPDPMQADLVGRELEKLAMMVILLLIVIVAAFNIISTLIMVVTDKTREIGILKSMGLTSRRVQKIFMLQGLVIGVVGSTLGAAGGLVLTWVIDRYELIKIPGDVYFVDHLPVAWDPVDVLVILISSVAISFVATLYPSRQAAALLPVEAIRHE
ncbi:MAG TPA: ABC transporter permease [Longimicrobiaceae bacterium]|nr:ABC transporter permease [Longimicrobiaceae bacterium]